MTTSEPDDATSVATEPVDDRPDQRRTWTRRALGVAATASIALGVVLLAQTAYAIWGTNREQAASQRELGEEFEQLLAESQQIAAPPEEPESAFAVADASGDAANGRDHIEVGDDGDQDDGATRVDAAAADAPTNVVPAEQLFVERGQAIGAIRIPAIGVEQYLVQGTTAEDLERAPGHYVTTAMPGTAGNVGIAGHRMSYGAPFERLDELRPGDEIEVETTYGTFTYVVDAHGDERTDGHVILPPDASWVLGHTEKNQLTLTSCHPKFSLRERIIVTATLVGDPVEPLV